jgi:RNA polymerase sigma factor (sigma-70 family)
MRPALAEYPPPHVRPGPSRVSEREVVLAAKASDGDGRERLTETFLPLIRSVARIYRGSAAVDRTELMQAGVVGLLHALEQYDPTLGTPFWAYASWWVRRSMQQLVSELTRPVVLSDRALRQLARVKDAQREHLQSHGAEPTLRDLASETGMRPQQVETLMAADRKPRGLEEPVHGDEDTTSTFGDLLADPRAEDAYESVPRRLAAAELGSLLRLLTERERLIVRARYGLGGPEQTLRELAANLGISAERVRQIEQEALGKLRLAVRC